MIALAARCLWRRYDGADVGRLGGNVGGGGIAADGTATVDDRFFEALRSPHPPSPADISLASLAHRCPGLLPSGVSEADLQRLFANLRCNGFALSDEAGCVLGACCHPRPAVFNHSCSPNCVVIHSARGELHVRTACHVGAGEQASECTFY